MSAKNPEWFELPADRWQEMSTVRENRRSWRDSQRQKLYDAESRFKRLFFWEVDKGWKPEYEQIKFKSIQEVEYYVTQLWNSAWVQKRFRIHKTSVPTINEISNSSWSAYVRFSTMYLPPWGFNKIIVLHELAHVLHPSGYGTGHGRFFARTFLELIGHEFGSEARKLLKECYKKHGVKSNPKPQYSPESLEKMRKHGQRMAAILEKKRENNF